jgi:hypothetical protein
MLNDRRIGKILVPLEFINKAPDSIKAMMAGMIVIRAEYDFQSGSIDYLALHDDFKEVEVGREAYNYAVYAHQTDGVIDRIDIKAQEG